MRRMCDWIISFVVLSWVFGQCLCQETCYPAGGVAGIVVATIIVTAVVTVLAVVLGWRIWKRKKVRKKQPDSSRREPAPKAPGEFAFDNPYFRDQEEDEPDSVQRGKNRSSLNNKSPLRTSKSDGNTPGNKGKKAKSAKGHNFIFGGGGVGATRKQRAMDDTYLAAEPERTVVALKGHDFTGLGFNICGNMRDGILVKDVLHRGPASESGKIKAGDRIISVTVSFTNIVYEDALTILSYASPYDVQLELERTPDKSSNMEESPATSKRLGSGSFSNTGPKLFHPLYRSQSIDDLTQIDRDTFPSHGLGPRRSQSVGVAAHKLAAHFKNSDTRLEEKDRPSASVILSTTGSLNEKMLANVIADGNLHKCGLQWEKRFEDNLEDEPTEIDHSKSRTTLSNISSTVPKTPVSSTDDDKTTEISEDRLNCYKKVFENSNKRSSKKGNSETGNEVQITAQIHQHSNEAKDRKSKSMSEASNAVWHLDQTIKDADSDLDSSKSYPWNGETSSNNKDPHRGSKRFESEDRILNSGRPVEESDVSGDSLEREKHRRKKKQRPKTPSVDDMPYDTTNCDLHKGSKTPDSDKDRSYSAGSFQCEQRIKKSRKTPDIPSTREQNCSLESVQDRRNSTMVADKYSCDIQTGRNTSTSTAGQMCSKDKRMERAVFNPAHSPNLSIPSPHPKPECCPIRNESPYLKMQHYQHGSPYNSSANSSESSSRAVDRTFHNERSDSTMTSRNVGHKYIQNQANSVSENQTNNRGRYAPQQYQPRPQHYVDYQKSPHIVERHQYEEEIKRMDPPRSGPPSYYQALRKANPAGMFTQINPFQQPTNRQRNNFSSKPWSGKEHTVNGNDSHYPVGYPKSMPVTTSDSSGRPRSRMEPPPYPQKMGDGPHSKTVLISSFDNSNNNSPQMNFRQVRK